MVLEGHELWVVIGGYAWRDGLAGLFLFWFMVDGGKGRWVGGQVLTYEWPMPFETFGLAHWVPNELPKLASSPLVLSLQILFCIS